MTEHAILNQILQNQQEHAKALGGIDARLNGVEKKVDDNTILTKDIQVKTYNLNSWKDGIVHLIIEEKEKAIKIVDDRLTPLEEHLKNHKEVKAEDKKVWLDILKHAISLVIGSVSTLVGINLNK